MEGKKVYKKWRMKEKKAWEIYKVETKRQDRVKSEECRASGEIEAHKGKKHQRK
jgi:hypothetical protein